MGATLGLCPKRRNRKLDLLFTYYSFLLSLQSTEYQEQDGLSMVRTRNNRGGGDDGGNSNKESSSSLKPASLSSRLATAGAASKKKGRKRQLGEGSSREEEEIGLVEIPCCRDKSLNSFYSGTYSQCSLEPRSRAKLWHFSCSKRRTEGRSCVV